MSNTNKVSITLHIDGDVTAKDILNAVRRATATNPDIAPGAPVTTKGVTLKVRPVKVVPVAPKSAVRDWLAANGHPEVVGKRGRIARDLLAKYEAAHK